MKCAVRIILLLILSLAVTVGVAHGISISIGNAESANYFSSAAWEGKLILYDSANYRYSVISVGGSELCDMPSLTILEEADGRVRPEFMSSSAARMAKTILRLRSSIG